MVAQIDSAMMKVRPLKVPGRLYSWALIEGRPLTTSGRWINRLVFAGYRLATRLPSRKQAFRPIYIIGAGRSGTTVLGKLFAIHRQTVFLNEPKAIWHYAHGGEDIAGSYSTAAASFRLAAADATVRRAEIIARIYSMALRVGMAERVVDKYPELIFRMPFVRRLFPAARFVGLQRDGVDTCASIDRWSRMHGSSQAEQVDDWWGRDDRKWNLIVSQLVPEHPDLAAIQDHLAATGDHCDRAAVEWILVARELRALRNEQDVLVVRYEDMCDNPDEALEAMIRHCQLSSDSAFLDYARKILVPPASCPNIRLDRQLVPIFNAELAASGYHASLSRVTARRG